MTTNHLNTLFSGKKAKWLAIYRRLVARLENQRGIELTPSPKSISVSGTIQIGKIRVTAKGLELAIALGKAAPRSERLKTLSKPTKAATHKVLIAQASDIDEELLSWIKAAQVRARISKRQSA